MQAGVDQDSERDVQRTGSRKVLECNREQRWGRLFQNHGRFSQLGPSPQAPAGAAWALAGSQVVGLPPGVPRGNPGVLQIRMHFPESSSSCVCACLKDAGQGRSGWVTGTHTAQPALSCLPVACLDLAVLTAQPCGSVQLGLMAALTAEAPQAGAC